MATKRFTPTELRLLELKLNGENLPRNNDGSVSKVVKRIILQLSDEGYLIKDEDDILRINPEKQAEWQSLLGLLPVPTDAQIVADYYKDLPAQTPETLLDAAAFEQPESAPTLIPLADALEALHSLRFCLEDQKRNISEQYRHGWETALDTATDRIEDLAPAPETILVSPAFAQPTAIPMIPLHQVMCILEGIRAKAHANEDSYYEAMDHALTEAIDEVKALDVEPETPPTYTTEPEQEALPSPPADGSEEICEEFTIHWQSLEERDHPFFFWLSYRLLSWATRNIHNGFCSNIADDYDWGGVFVAANAFPDLSIFDKGHNYVDIALRPKPTHESPMIRVVQNYRFDPGYIKHHARITNRV